MKRNLVALVLLVAGAAAADPARVSSPPVTLDHPLLAPLIEAQSFDCSNRSCTQLNSCAEACHKLLVCGQRQRDGDNDGIPCENLCSRRC
ncbi:excalibur calcium-binding domain-containing protein [Wenxinia marina]|uniref:Excalibur calcium-binding domain protein n=1 Tax=Wenxinia marina DSM 24838 TaxID=1123501 RepID=A0A0D0NHT2_9RHOB|nr:excalibur calcium-binding domain-containing protein [Wenxinia marina]KIQ67910.1 Excalibur calcium-binding domain protein [Wenxinia marina DSM 24838]GGL74173.1 hypothetical protein GCM10011392_30860 [Wenxinia marina]